jgi:hypothetical protein
MLRRFTTPLSLAVAEEDQTTYAERMVGRRGQRVNVNMA